MYILKNAMHNLVRNRGRNLMIGGIVFVIIVSVVTALMINNTAGSVINDYQTRFGSEVRLSPNQQKLQEEARQNSVDGMMRLSVPQIAPEDLIKYGQSDYLQKAVYDVSANADSDDLIAVNADLGPGGGPRMMRMGPDSTGMPSGDSGVPGGGIQYYFRMTNAFDEFLNGTRTLDDAYDTTDFQGRFPDNINECLVSSDLMDASKLSLGDTVTVTSRMRDMSSTPENEIITEINWDLLIVGVYSDLTQTDNDLNNLQSAYEDRRNEILTTFDTITANMNDNPAGIRVNATYYLKDPDQLEAYTAELRNKGLSTVWDVSTDSAAYNRIVKPVVALKGITLTFVIIVLIFGAIILALLASIAIRERKYEIGVLRAMGMKKLKVLSGLWTETLAITLICLILGLGVGTLIAQPVTNILYQQQLAAVEESTVNQFPGPGGPGGMIQGQGRTVSGFMLPGGSSDVQPLQKLDVSLNGLTILEIVAIAILLSSLSGIIATQRITKYEPIKILMERN
ncbi:MAG: ABC transporter permease [Peptococcaceae bacterium]|nr:ABC transporter permease [Peptococcaceae bacterium]